MKTSKKLYMILLVTLLLAFMMYTPGGSSANGINESSNTSVQPKADPDSPGIKSGSESGLGNQEHRARLPLKSNANDGVLKRLVSSFNKLFVAIGSTAPGANGDDDDDADLPPGFNSLNIDKTTYLQLRDEHIARLRGIEQGLPFDINARGNAIATMQQQQDSTAQPATANAHIENFPAGTPPWIEIGPRSVPNGQTQTNGVVAPVDGRLTAIVVDPTNANIIYVGSAQGGVWRSTNGGTTWRAIFDNAQSLAIGALAIAPSNHSILYIGTGEPNLSADSYFGVGLYRIDNADTTAGALADLKGPINPSFSFVANVPGNPTITTTVFGGRSISQIAVNPTDPATVYVGTSTGIGGLGGSSLSGFVPPLALVGVYRSTNATSAPASITFQKLAVPSNGGSLDTPGTGNRRISDLILEPGNPNNLLVSTFGAVAPDDGGIFRSTNALAATPSFTQTLNISATRIRFAIQKTGAVVTVLAATSEVPAVASCAVNASQQGILRRSVDGGITWPATNVVLPTDGGIIPSAGGYCGGQCFYNVTVAINPANANSIYLGGNAHSTCSDAMKHSSDGLTFARDDNSIHADSHALTFDATGANIFTGSDGGIWRRADEVAGTPWQDLNSSPLNTMQFQSLAVHPTDRSFTIGGTQDNGTEAQQAFSGNWTSAEGGDGGYTLIDQSSTDTVNVTMYHTFFNQAGSLIGFDRANLGSCLAVKNGWESRGFGFGTSPAPSCDGSAFAAPNGIVGTDNVLFYAPMELGPGTPNTLYFGTSRLYRSTDKGDTMTTVSQVPLSGTTNANGSPISTIAISPQDDTFRMVGLLNGKVFGTSTGASTLVDITSASFPANPTGSATNKYVGRARFDPNNKNIAYVTFSFYAPAGQGIWKITNFGAATNAAPVAPTWTAAGAGIPSIPINALAIDPSNSSNLFAGTDIGVYVSRNGGTSWTPYGTGLPSVAVFDAAIQPTSRTLRVATHGRGMWEIGVVALTGANPSISGRVTASDGSPLAGVTITLSSDSGNQQSVTNTDGGYSFANTRGGGFYSVTPTLANYSFSPASRGFSLNANVTDAVFTGSPDAVVTGNPLDASAFFVRQQYIDFLGREPDQPGLDFWTGQFASCKGDAACVRGKRIDVSAAFFMSQEFQDTGSYVFRLYRAAFARRPDYAEFTQDRGKVVGGVNLVANKAAFAEEFVNRDAFRQLYPDSLSHSDFVNTLFDSAGLTPYLTERSSFISALDNGASRSSVLSGMIDDAAFKQREYNPSFVAMQYYGYLKRDLDEGGYAFWLDVVNNRDVNNYQGMVCSFITSAEYQRRFSSIITSTNAQCGP